MTIRIGTMIAELRKERRMTQEQLAAAVGVSIAAVSKWECESSYPDITILPAIASFFDVSVDTLLGHQVQSGQAQRYSEQLKQHTAAFDLDAGLSLAEEALIKYPNDFDILRHAAQLQMFKANADDCDNAEKELHVEQAVDRFQRALTVRPSNSPVRPEILKILIAYTYGDNGKYDQAIAILEELNVRGVMDAEIARYLIRAGRHSEAQPKLQSYLWTFASTFGTLVHNLNECFKADGNTALVIDLQQLHAEFMERFTGETPSDADLLCVWSFFGLAKDQRDAGDIEGMWGSLARGVHHALRFDANPSYEQSAVKFMAGTEGYMNKVTPGHACRDAIRELTNKFAEFAHDERYITWLQKLKAADSGVDPDVH
ncbi:helix-turn-helix domain-containing protein [Paenibacillus sp. PR3]|uniref:Helix-turn-helix domain-containing protein n=1 Tax=Paenibacillus terricola TaxID=2763503 RepID=A0ABR8N2V4_9BACL|nr:helix-turn-helix transcriptional regulator [Paenibacillus terricola]MBD3921871.1 helix-turn-helix domain-containing protein [Paenibacillus terricola]